MDFLSTYLAYRKQTEAPYIYHRWAAISAVGALLGRKIWFPFGDQRIFPNMYIMLIGEPAARKSTAIKQMKKLLIETGYDKFAADKTRQEKFLMDLAGIVEGDSNGQYSGKTREDKYDAVTASNLGWGDSLSDGNPKEVYISSDEFSDFTPPGSGEFYTLLGNLWDWDEESRPFKHKLKNSKDVIIQQPTISLLGGITPELFSKTFPPEIIGTGFLSRMVLIHGERSGRKYTIPPLVDANITANILESISEIANRGDNSCGSISHTPEAYHIFDSIYHSWQGLDDSRFRHYEQRRATQFYKLCIITSVCAGKEVIDEETAIYANTILSAAEKQMPKALGEFGKSKNSSVSNIILELLGEAHKPMKIAEIWKHVIQDLEKVQSLTEIMQGLVIARKVQNIPGVDGGFLAMKVYKKDPDYVDWSLLTEDERKEL